MKRLVFVIILAACSDSPTSPAAARPGELMISTGVSSVLEGYTISFRFVNTSTATLAVGVCPGTGDIFGDRAWALLPSMQLCAKEPLLVPPGLIGVEAVVDITGGLAPGVYSLSFGVSRVDGQERGPVADVPAPVLEVVADPFEGRPEFAITVTESSASAGSHVQAQLINGLDTAVSFTPFGCGWYDVQRFSPDIDDWVTVPSFHAEGCPAYVVRVGPGEIFDVLLGVPTTAGPGSYRFAVPAWVLDSAAVFVSTSFEVP